MPCSVPPYRSLLPAVALGKERAPQNRLKIYPPKLQERENLNLAGAGITSLHSGSQHLCGRNS
jgi:hypothetical protein